MSVFRKIFSWVLMAALLLNLLPMAAINARAATGTIYLQMSDSYGDGWNDNKIALYIDGVFSANYTFTNGYGSSAYISYDSAQSYEFKWVKGRYSSECSFTLSMDGVTQLSASSTMCSGYTDGQTLYSIEASVEYDLEGEFAGGSGTASDPYLVATKAQLDNVRNYPNDHFLQVRDIAFTASDFATGGDFYNDGKGWVPICDGDNDNFYGTYDGNGRTISGLTITQGSTYVGLFGRAIGSIVNVNMTGLSYTATESAYAGSIVGYGIYNQGEVVGCTASGTITVKRGYVGGIVGSGGTVMHCTSNVAITVSESVWDSVGGIAGDADQIFGCENNGNILVQGEPLNVGGIVGYAADSISNCKNTGSVTAEATEEYASIYAGGIVGCAYGTITRCENAGAVIGSGCYAEVGGIVGVFCSSSAGISLCVNRGKVSSTASSGTNVSQYSHVGGICGQLEDGSIENCYVTGTATLTSRGSSNAYAGGIVGFTYSETVITNCYTVVSSVNVNTSASGWGRGGIAGYNAGVIDNCYYYYSYGVGYNNGTALVSRVSALSNFAKQSTYYDFDFTSTWKMGTDSYTYAVLRMESGHAHTLTPKAATVTHDASGKLAHWYCASCDTYFRNASGTLYTTSDALESDPLPRTGTCGTDVNWVLTYEGVLTISGTGAMADYQSAGAPWYSVRDKVKKVVVEDGVTVIGSYAFEGCGNLTDVKLPETLTSVGAYAFSGCTALPQLVLPEAVTTVGDGAFSQITKLVIAFTGNAPTFGGANVFSGTTASAHYPANNATWTTDLKQAYGGTVTWNGFDALDQVIVASGDLSYAISWQFSVTGILRVTGSYYTSMNNYTYSSRPAWEAYQDRITALVLKNINSVGNYAFYNYTALEKVDLGCAKTIGQRAFYNCDALKRVFVEYGNGNCEIGSYAFYDCASLEEVAFSSSTTIGSNAFAYCQKLKNIYINNYGNYSPVSEYALKPATDSFYNVVATVYLPKNWTILSGTSYNYGGTLTWVRTNSGPCGPDAYWTYDEATTTVTIFGTGRMGYYCAGDRCPWYAFKAEAKYLVIEDGITDIPAYAFEFMEKIETAKMPNTLQTLSCNAFNNCRSLNNLLLPASLTYLESNYYLNRCDALTDVYYMGTAEDWAKVANHSVIGGSYDNVERVHFLQLQADSATCTTPGKQPYYRFDDTSVYGGLYDAQYQPITNPGSSPALGHDYTSVVTEPTCAEGGYTTYTCRRCGDRYTGEATDALEHSYVDGVCTACGAEGVYTIVFKDWDGTVISTNTYHYGDAVIIPEAPTRAADDMYTYTFAGWDKEIVDCAGDATYTATYTSEYIDYTVVFKDWNGDVLSTKTYHYDDKVIAPAEPVKAADATYTYAFAGWDKEIVECAGDATYTATYTPCYINYMVKFLNDDGTVLSEKTYHYGDKVIAPAEPVKAADATYTYAFAGWDKEIVDCAGDATYIATYTSEYIDYTVVFKDWNGDVLSTKTYHYGDKVTAPDDPAKAADKAYTYTFSGWDKEIVDCAGDATYTATYTSDGIDYTVVFQDWDGTVLSTIIYHWGDTVTVPEDPTRAADEVYAYTFAGWDKSVVDCAGDATYTATYTSEYIDYTIVFKNWNGDVLSTKTYHYGDKVTAPADPAKAADATYTYAFAGWDKEVVDCVGDATYTATYTPCYINYTVKFLNADGTVLSEKTYHYGDKVIAPAEPTKAADATYTYSFKDWDKSVVDCAGDATYTATYTSVYIDYTVVFKDWNGDVLSTKTYHYGDEVTAPVDLTKESDKTYTYIFAGWDHNVVNCAGDATYTAIYTSEYINYMITFQYEDGTVINQYTLHYGDSVVVPDDPSAPEALGDDYAFNGWDKEITDCQGDAVYTAMFVRKYSIGDVDCNGGIDVDDVVALLLYVAMPDVFPMDSPADFDNNGTVDVDDVVALLLYVAMPDVFPL